MTKKNNIQLKHEDIPFEASQFPVHILAHNIELAGNIGSLFRIADAFGIEKLYLSDQLEIVSPLKIRKAARSTQKTVNYCYIESAIDLVKGLQADGYTIISLEVTSASQSLREFVEGQHPLKKVCLIVGSEKEGITQALLDASDYTLHIPMYGGNSSMNVVTATAITLYELTNKMTSINKDS
ncbi:MAG: TrmH family RNA methyltransferase [Thiotrichaceae bacterium]